MSDEEADSPRRYRVILSDIAEADRDRNYLHVQRIVGTDFAHRCLEHLKRALDGIPVLMGPRIHPIALEESERFGVEVRCLLYRGPTGKSQPAYRILFMIHEPAPDESEGAVLVLRIVHGSRGMPQSSDE